MSIQYRSNRMPLAAPGEIDHHVDDLSATIAADVTLSRVQQKLGESGQWLPIDGDSSLSAGQLVELNSTGPLRLGYGHWRDLLLGAQFQNGEGELITAGGRTVKNVAGYDLTKVMVGQRGVFGKIVTITTRTYKQPVGAILATFAPRAALISRLLPSPAKPQWALLTSDALLCGYVGDERTLAYYSNTLSEWTPRDIQRRPLVDDVTHRAQLWRGSFRAAVPPTKIDSFIAAAKPQRWSADVAFGIIVGDGDRAALRDAATRNPGVVTFNDERNFFDVAPGAQRDLLTRLKKSFDPDNKLAPLPWLTA